MTVYYPEDRLRQVFEKTGGRCYYCGKRLAFENRGYEGWGSWDVDHKVPRARGGSDNLRNLFPACWECNHAKSSGDPYTYMRSLVPVSPWQRFQEWLNGDLREYDEYPRRKRIR